MAAAAGLEPASFPVNSRASSPGRLSRNVAGTAGRSRTCGLCARNAVLCPLSYGGMASKMLWSGWLDLNQRPPGSGPGTLTRLRYTQPKHPRIGRGGWIRTNGGIPRSERGAFVHSATPRDSWRRVRGLNPSFHLDRVASVSLDPRGM